MSKPILIFPAGMPRSLEFLQRCLQEGRTVVGSSSLAYDPAREYYPTWRHLPYVTDPSFDEAIRALVNEFGIDEIYTPNFAVWNYLNQNMARLLPGVRLANISPVDEVLSGYRVAISKAKGLIGDPLPLASGISQKSLPAEIEVAAFCRYADLIPGMCDDDKLHALLEIARRSVQGDIVEIGSWWGKSAFILSWLARRFEIGSLLCVDPWANENLIQNEKIVDSGSAQVDAGEALNVFQIGLIPFNFNHINYLRMTSVDGARSYGARRSVSSEVFGKTEYAGQISVLHIDGNHAYEAAKADIEAWGGFVAPGGWIIIDDYNWPYGDGPHRVGDEFLETNYSRLASAFVMGGALFMQLASHGKFKVTLS